MTNNVSPQLIIDLASYADLSISRERAETLALVLGPALTRLRSIRPSGYENLVPGINFRVPVPAPDEPKI